MEEREWSWKRTDRKAKKLAVKELPYQLDGSIIEDQVPELPRDRGMRKVLEHVISSTQGNFDALRGELIKSGQYHNEHADETNYMKSALLPHEHPGTGFQTAFYPGGWFNPTVYGGLCVDNEVLLTDFMKLIPLWAGDSVSLDRMAFSVATAGGASTVARVGIYQGDQPGYLPGSLIVDGGTIGTNTTGGKVVTIDADLHGGNWYWLAIVGQGAGADALTTGVDNTADRSTAPWWPFPFEIGGTTWPGELFPVSYGYQPVVSGALPSTLSTDIPNDLLYSESATLIQVRAA